MSEKQLPREKSGKITFFLKRPAIRPKKGSGAISVLTLITEPKHFSLTYYSKHRVSGIDHACASFAEVCASGILPYCWPVVPASLAFLVFAFLCADACFIGGILQVYFAYNA
jgi:hypothetical protein